MTGSHAGTSVEVPDCGVASPYKWPGFHCRYWLDCRALETYDKAQCLMLGPLARILEVVIGTVERS